MSLCFEGTVQCGFLVTEVGGKVRDMSAIILNTCQNIFSSGAGEQVQFPAPPWQLLSDILIVFWQSFLESEGRASL